MLTNAMPKMRLLLIKSDVKNPGKYKHSGNHYLLNGRWHAIHKDKPVPKGAAVAAHPHAAGAPVPGKVQITDEQWEQLKLPADNSNASTFNKQLDQLKAAAMAGDVTGILGSGFGTNTYSKKLVGIANKVLGFMGSTHAVTPGQKPGAHPAVQTAPEIEAGVAAPVNTDDGAPKPADPFPTFADHDKADVASGLSMPAFDGETVGQSVIDYYQPIAQKVMDLAAAGDVAGLEAMKADGLKPNKKGKIGNTWKGKTPNSKLLLDLHAKALAHASGSKPTESKPADLPSAGTVTEPAASTGQAQPKQSKPHELDLSEYKTGAWAPTLSSKTFKGDNPAWYSQESGSAIQVAGTMKFEGQPPSEYAQKTLAEYKAAKAAGYEFQNFKASGLQHAYVFVKDGKILTKEGMAALVAGGANPNAEPASVSEPTAAPEPAPIKKEPRLILPKTPRVAAPAPSGKANLDQIPWDTQLLPAKNKNAKSHNKQIEKIKAMAYAGDVAGLEAFKAGKNTYGKKQNLLAQTALEALKDGGDPANKAAEPDTLDGGPTVNTPVPEKYKKVLDNWAAAGDKGALQTMIDNNKVTSPHLAAYAQKKLDEIGGQDSAPKPVTPDAAPPASDNLIMLGIAKLNANQKISKDGKAVLEAHLKEHPGDLVGAAKQAKDYGYLATYDAAMGLAADLDLEPPDDDDGPQEGDTKQGADGMLVFKDGRWHKVEEAKPVDAKAAAAKVPMPKLTSGTGKLKYTKTMKHLKEIAEQQGAEGLSKAVKISPLGHVKITGYKSINPDGSQYGKNAELMAQYAKALHQAVVGANAVGSGAPAAAKQAPAVAPSAPSSVEAMDSWTQTGPQAGSNPGGRFKDANGQEWYCKFPADEDMAKAEVLAAKLYAALGMSGQDAKLITKDGKVGIASKWTTVSKASSPSALAKVDGVAAGFGADAWLANWDVVGLAYDNLQIGSDGKAHRVDAGGSLMYRAQGGKKAFGSSVIEIDSLRDPKINPQAAAVFGGMTEADITASVAKVLKLSDAQINTLVAMYGPGDDAAKKALAATLIARKQDLANKFPKAVKAKPQKHQFDPQKLSAPPNFFDFYGETGSGYKNGGPLSSKNYINSANQAAVDAVFAAAKEGNLDAIKNVQSPVFDKNTGLVTSHVPLSQHPSKHVRGYWADMVTEVDLQLNPPEIPEIGLIVEGDELREISSALPPVPSGKAIAAVEKHQKVGNYIVLGKIANILPFIPKSDDTAIGSSTWIGKAKSMWSAAKQAAKDAFYVYKLTSGAKAINTALREGKVGETYDGKTVEQYVDGIKELLMDIPEGSTFVRNMGMKGWGQKPNEKAIKELQQFLMTAEPGTVLQEPGLSSTSWTGGNSVLANNDIQWEFVATKGVRMYPGWLTGNKGEGEGLLPPNQRYAIISSKKIGKTVRVKAILLPTVD